MDALLFCVRCILVIACLEIALSHGDSCDCDLIKQTFSNEIFDLKIENLKLNSRIESIESMMRERKEMQPSLTEKDAAQIRLLDEERARLEPNLERKALNNLLLKGIRSEKKERLRSELKIEEGLGRLNRSLKEFDEHAKALIASHENTMSHVIQEFNNKAADSVANIRKDVLSVVEKLKNQTNDLLNSRTNLESVIEDISQNASRMDADISSVIDIVLLEQKAECEPNCKNGGVCFMDGSCRCKTFTAGGHCERFFCTDECIENGGECEGPGLCKCPEGQYGNSCENNHCTSNPCNHGRCESSANGFKCICDNGFTGATCDTSIASDCYDIYYKNISKKSGVYYVTLWKSKKTIQVYCDMDTFPYGWTVFQKRFNGSVDFYQNFSQYTDGFGSVHGELWLGLRHVEEMASQYESDLRVDVTAADNSHVYEQFENFSLSKHPDFTLHLGRQTVEQIPDNDYGVYFCAGQRFSTYDHDVDIDKSRNCALIRHGGWWYWHCVESNLNGEYVSPPGSTSSYDNGWGGFTYSKWKKLFTLKSSKIMFRKH